jgi:hypothetical protein
MDVVRWLVSDVGPYEILAVIMTCLITIAVYRVGAKISVL